MKKARIRASATFWLLLGGERGIRTPGDLRLNGFQDRRIKPLCHLSESIKNAKLKIKKAKNISDKTASGNTEYIVENDLLKKKETEIFHLRPHSDKSAYLIKGKKYGNGKETDMDELPNGDKMTKQCFWLNNTYIEKVIKDI